jgi:hypothetical protein
MVSMMGTVIILIRAIGVFSIVLLMHINHRRKDDGS